MNRLKERRLELGLTQEAVSGILKLWQTHGWT